jgi:hypothetical protein
MNPFDQAARYTIRNLDAVGQFRWLLREAVRHWRWTGWLDTQTVPFPGEPERRIDTVAALARIAEDRPPVAAVVEFQTRPVGEMLERVAEYALRLRRELPYQTQPRVPYDVVGVVVNLTGPPQEDTWSMAPPDFGPLALHFTAGVRTLRDLDAAALLADVEAGRESPGLLAWVPLMRGADEAAVVAQWRRLAERESDSRRRGDYGGIARVFAELTKRQEVWRTGLEGWNMEVSQVVLEWQAQALARGRAEGLALARREDMLRILRTRFKMEVPADLAAAVQAQTDPAVLDRWFDVALTEDSMAKVRAAWGLP